jgi:hypothetical protein
LLVVTHQKQYVVSTFESSTAPRDDWQNITALDLSLGIPDSPYILLRSLECSTRFSVLQFFDRNDSFGFFGILKSVRSVFGGWQVVSLKNGTSWSEFVRIVPYRCGDHP